MHGCDVGQVLSEFAIGETSQKYGNNVEQEIALHVPDDIVCAIQSLPCVVEGSPKINGTF